MRVVPAALVTICLLAGFAGPGQCVRASLPESGGTGGAVVKAHGFLGVTIDPSARGLRVDLVLAGGPADRFGIKEGDVILSIDDVLATRMEVLARTIAAHQPGERVAVRVLRCGGKRVIEVTLGERPRGE